MSETGWLLDVSENESTTATEWWWPVCFACNSFGGCHRHPSRQWLALHFIDAAGWRPPRPVPGETREQAARRGK